MEASLSDNEKERRYRDRTWRGGKSEMGNSGGGGIQAVRRQAISQEMELKAAKSPAVSMVSVAETIEITQHFHF
jgi:hypothetical protein